MVILTSVLQDLNLLRGPQQYSPPFSGLALLISCLIKWYWYSFISFIHYTRKEGQAGRQADSYTGRKADEQRGKQASRQTERQAGNHRQTVEPTDWRKSSSQMNKKKQLLKLKQFELRTETSVNWGMLVKSRTPIPEQIYWKRHITHGIDMKV